MTRLLFLGTPAAAVPTLEALASRYRIGLVVTQPDRPKGRSRRPTPPPVKERAVGLGVPLAQPDSGTALHEQIAGAGPFDAGVVVAYGRILRPDVLALPERGFLNLHFSLLPRWRGAAPVERALIAGDEMTGVTIIKLDEGLDTGPVLTAQAVDIGPGENAGALTSRLAHIGARLIAEVVGRYLAGDLEPVPQSDEGATYAPKLTGDDRPIRLDRGVTEVINQVRGLAPDPAATLEIDGERHKIYAVAPGEQAPSQGSWQSHEGMPVFGVADGGVALVELQPPGKNRQRGQDWLRGRRSSGGVVA